MEYNALMSLCWENLPFAKDNVDVLNIRMAARLAWEQKELGGLEHWQFAYRNNTPIVPVGHCCHPIELVKRGFVDGKGWPKVQCELDKVKYFKWLDGNHWYASYEGKDIVHKGLVKWNSQQQAEKNAKEWLEQRKSK